MKPNKKICKKCYRQDTIGWTKHLDKLWNDESFVYCLAEMGKGKAARNINDPLSKNCPYYLEHILSNQ